MPEGSNMEDLLDYMKKALEKMTLHINTTEPQVRSERRRWKKPSLYKTELCDHWRNKRKCIFGLKCWYAHGPQDLRPSSSTCSSTNSCTTTGGSADELSAMSLYGVALEAPPARPAITVDGETTLRGSEIACDIAASAPNTNVVENALPPLTYSTAMAAPIGPYHVGTSQPQEMRPAFFVSFDSRMPYAAAQPTIMQPHYTEAAVPVPSTSTSTAQAPPPMAEPMKPTDPNFQQQQPYGIDMFRSSNFGFSTGMNLGLSGFGFPAGPPPFASSDNWMASSFIIPSKNVWLRP